MAIFSHFPSSFSFLTNALKLKVKHEAAGSVLKCGSRLILANEAFIATFKCTGGSYLCF